MNTIDRNTILAIANAAIIAVYDDTADVGENTGTPWYDREPVNVDAGIAGLVPSAITWTTDRGNWMWDGVCATLRAMGVDTDKPL